MKELLKSDNICQRYAQMKKFQVFWLTVYIMTWQVKEADEMNLEVDSEDDMMCILTARSQPSENGGSFSQISDLFQGLKIGVSSGCLWENLDF